MERQRPSMGHHREEEVVSVCLSVRSICRLLFDNDQPQLGESSGACGVCKIHPLLLFVCSNFMSV